MSPLYLTLIIASALTFSYPSYGHEDCIQGLKNPSSFSSKALRAPQKTYENLLVKIREGQILNEFSFELEKMNTDIQRALSLEHDSSVSIKIFKPLIEQLTHARQKGVQYLDFLELSAKYSVAMDISKDNQTEDLFRLHEEFKKEQAAGVIVDYMLKTTPPIDLNTRVDWYHERLRWMLGGHPGSPNSVMKELRDTDSSPLLQIPSFYDLSIKNFLLLWIEGLSPMWLADKSTSEGWPSATLTHDWRHEIGARRFSQEEKVRLRNVMKGIGSTSSGKARLLSHILLFMRLHERLDDSKKALQITEESNDVYAQILRQIQNGQLGLAAKVKLSEFKAKDLIAAGKALQKMYQGN